MPRDPFDAGYGFTAKGTIRGISVWSYGMKAFRMVATGDGEPLIGGTLSFMNLRKFIRRYGQ